MRGSVLGLPLWLILAVCVVPPIAYSLSRAAGVPVELILPTAVAMEVVFLTQTVQQALRRAEVRRHFGFALWELHQELSQHLESLDRRMTLVRQGVNSEPNLDSLRTWASSVDAFPVDAWDRFLAIVDRRDTEAYHRWRERHGDVPAASNKTHRDWSIHDDPVR